MGHTEAGCLPNHNMSTRCGKVGHAVHQKAYAPGKKPDLSKNTPLDQDQTQRFQSAR